MKLVAVSLLALGGIAAASDLGSPVEKIVKLLAGMKETISNDGKAEQRVYDRYACWCETSAKTKANDIVQAQADMRSVGQRILKLKGKVGTLAGEISELNAHIKENDDQTAQATAIRTKENAAAMAEAAETKQALASLEKGITVLAKATNAGKKGAALLQSALSTQSKSAVAEVLEKLPANIPSLPAKSIGLLSDFAEASSGYAPQSATIQGMLGDMYSNFASNLELSTEEEANKNANFETLTASIEKDTKNVKGKRDSKATTKAQAEAMLADSTKAYDDTEKQLKTDMDFFDQTKKACEEKHSEWTVRVEMRSQELEGVSKALDILSADENRALFAKSIKPGKETNFLQLESTPSLLQNSARLASAKAYNVIKVQVRKSHSLRLAALAVEVRTVKFGHFDKVIASLDKMVQVLLAEGDADQKKKDQCLSQYATLAKKMGKLDWKVDRNEAKVGQLEKLIEIRTQEKDDAITRIKATQAEIKQMAASRKEERESFMQEKKDDKSAIKVLQSAKVVLAKYYKKNKIAMGKLQGSVKLLQGPHADFSDKGSHKQASKSIISLMTYLIQDLQDEVKNGWKNERTATADFLKETADAEEVVKDLVEKKVTLQGILATRVEDKTGEVSDLKANKKERRGQKAWKAKITPDCDWIMKAFTERATDRAAEIEGLTASKAFLAGGIQGLGLIEKEQKFDDEKLGSVGFMGIQ